MPVNQDNRGLGDREVARTQDFDKGLGHAPEDQLKEDSDRRNEMIGRHNERLGRHMESGGFRGGMHIIDTMQGRREEDRRNAETARQQRDEVQRLNEARDNRRRFLAERFGNIDSVNADTERAELLARGH